MLIDDQRYLHEDLERLEQSVSDRAGEEPRQIRDQINRDHHIAKYLTRIQDQSQRLLEIYNDSEGLRAKELQQISLGDPFAEFYRRIAAIKDFHRRYPNEPVENLEKAYRRKPLQEGESATALIDNLFTGEEAYGRYLDLNPLHEVFLNLPGVKRVNYLAYLQVFDRFGPPQMTLKRAEKRTDQYFRYLGQLASYLEAFHRKTRPLEELSPFLNAIVADFDVAWKADKAPNWEAEPEPIGPVLEGTGSGTWCAECGKEFGNDNVYKSHLSGKKHVKAVAAQKSKAKGKPIDDQRKSKDRAIAEREYRIIRMAASLETQREDTRVNVERRQGMTERERQQELEQLFAEPEEEEPVQGDNPEGSDKEDDGKIYNPLKLPMGWDGKPIPFWLYKLHGLGVEYSCEICGNYVYMGRRAFDKHFGEGRHVYGLKCLGITHTGLFREITGIDDAIKLWEKLQQDKTKQERGKGDIVQMEDAEGNVMPEKVYLDLQKQGLL